MVYSPLTKELIVISQTKIVGVSLKDNSIRNIYDLSGSGLSFWSLASDYRNLSLVSSSADSRGLSKQQFYTLKIINPTHPKSVDFILEQPNFDSSSNRLLTTEINTFHKSEAKGSIADSTKLIIHNLQNSQKKEVIVDGDARLIFSGNSYSYFFGKDEIMQINLDTGIVSKADSILSLLPYLDQTANGYRFGATVAPDGRHFLYRKGTGNSYFVYNLLDNSEQSFTPDQSCITYPNPKSSFSQIDFSQDSRFIIFNYEGNSVCVYDDLKQKLSVYKVPALPPYSIVTYTLIEDM